MSAIFFSFLLGELLRFPLGPRPDVSSLIFTEVQFSRCPLIVFLFFQTLQWLFYSQNLPVWFHLTYWFWTIHRTYSSYFTRLSLNIAPSGHLHCFIISSPTESVSLKNLILLFIGSLVYWVRCYVCSQFITCLGVLFTFSNYLVNDIYYLPPFLKSYWCSDWSPVTSVSLFRLSNRSF